MPGILPKPTKIIDNVASDKVEKLSPIEPSTTKQRQDLKGLAIKYPGYFKTMN